jgi:uncharacterized protein (DUF1330 family)
MAEHFETGTRMSAYIIASYDVVDEEGYAGYIPGVGPLLAKHNVEVLVADRDARALEGDKRSMYVVLRFESEAAALAWYNDPEYASVKKIRLDATTHGNLVLARQFVPPSD